MCVCVCVCVRACRCLCVCKVREWETTQNRSQVRYAQGWEISIIQPWKHMGLHWILYGYILAPPPSPQHRQTRRQEAKYRPVLMDEQVFDGQHQHIVVQLQMWWWREKVLGRWIAIGLRAHLERNNQKRKQRTTERKRMKGRNREEERERERERESMIGRESMYKCVWKRNEHSKPP